MTYCVKIAILLLKNKRKDDGLMWIKNVRLIGALTGGIKSECGAVRVLDGTIAEVSAAAPAAVWLDGEKVC